MKIYIICPDTVTGGTECLHQLGHALDASGADIFISYHNESKDRLARKSFKSFGLQVENNIKDSKDCLVIFPENLTKYSQRFPKSAKSIFWLSVDNFYPIKGVSFIRDIFAKYNIRNKRLNFKQIKNFTHLSQSFYSTSFLKKYGMESILIGDYLNDDFFKEADKAILENNVKLDQVCYNPAKGKKYLDYLIKKNIDINFIPIVNMTRHEVIKTLSQSKMYLDLGLHPGKDRIPREAAILGACIATSKFGSAKNNFDVPIPDYYKFDIDTNSLKRIPPLIKRVFRDYSNESLKFDPYRQKIRNEKNDFMSNCKSWLNDLDKVF